MGVQYNAEFFLGWADNYYISRGENNTPQLNYATVLRHRKNKKSKMSEKKKILEA